LFPLIDTEMFEVHFSLAVTEKLIKLKSLYLEPINIDTVI